MTAALAIYDRPIDRPAAAGRGATITDHELPLIRRAQAGDRDAFGELYARHQDHVRRFLVSRLREHKAEADDLLTETFITAMQRIGTFELDRPGEFGNWLVGIARHKLLTWLRRPARREIACDDLPRAAGADEVVSPEDIALNRIEVAEALATLTPRARWALVVQHVAGLPTAEIALALGTTKRVVWGLTGQARAQLRGQTAADEARPEQVAAETPAPVVLCACGCGVELPAKRQASRPYANARCRSRAAWQRRTEAQRLHLAAPATADPAVERVLALVEATGGNGVDRSELSQRTRLLAARLERALDLLARHHLVSVHLEPKNGRLVTRYRAPASAAGWRAA